MRVKPITPQVWELMFFTRIRKRQLAKDCNCRECRKYTVADLVGLHFWRGRTQASGEPASASDEIVKDQELLGQQPSATTATTDLQANRSSIG